MALTRLSARAGSRVDDRQLADAEAQAARRRPPRRRRRRRTGRRAPAHVGQFALEALLEARAIRVVPDAAAVLQHDRVDGAERRGLRRKLIEKRDHRLLAGMGDVQPRKSEPLRGGQDVRQRAAVEARARRDRSAGTRSAGPARRLRARAGAAFARPEMPEPTSPARTERPAGWCCCTIVAHQLFCSPDVASTRARMALTAVG